MFKCACSTHKLEFIKNDAITMIVATSIKNSVSQVLDTKITAMKDVHPLKLPFETDYNVDFSRQLLRMKTGVRAFNLLPVKYLSAEYSVDFIVTFYFDRQAVLQNH